ncbi:TPA: hypothetical protein SMF87_004529 [Serratia marcescens]|nr:hypothetical protein [Serratia marcescens]
MIDILDLLVWLALTWLIYAGVGLVIFFFLAWALEKDKFGLRHHLMQSEWFDFVWWVSTRWPLLLFVWAPVDLFHRIAAKFRGF